MISVMRREWMRAGTRGAVALAVCSALALALPARPAQAESDAARAALKLLLDGRADAGRALPGSMRSAMSRFYAGRGYQALWLGDNGTGPRGRQLLARLEDAARDGLLAGDYGVADLERLGASGDPGAQARFEMLLSQAAITYMNHLRQGRIPGQSIRPDIHRVAAAPVDADRTLRALANADDPNLVIDSEITDPRARRLRDAIVTYRALAARGSWPVLADGPTLEPGMTDERIPTLRERLALTDGAESLAAGDPLLYDDALAEATKRFQQRHGLEADGRIGLRSRLALNRTPEERLRQLAVNLDALRSAETPAGPHIVVNLPEFMLRVYEGSKNVMEMGVVVGRPSRATPVFASRITQVVFNPPWNVPDKLAREDILPQLKRSPAAVVAKGFKAYRREFGETTTHDLGAVEWKRLSSTNFPYVLRQEPGPKNALGRVRISMPNGDDIYLHDTPDRGLFRKDWRALSSGCIRLEKPLELVQYILRNTAKGTPEAVQAALAAGTTSVEHVSKQIPVQLAYVTAWVAEDGTVNFREDLYGLDKQLYAWVAKNGA